MAFDSTIRMRQLNQAELSGFITPIAQGIHSTTGTLSGVFYPLKSNPNGFISGSQTGAFKTQADLDSLYYQTLAYVSANFYPNTNPDGYISDHPASQPFSFNCTSGASTQKFTFPLSFIGTPRVTCNFVNNFDSDVYLLSVSGVKYNEFYVNYSSPIGSTGYYVDGIADYSDINTKSYSFEFNCTSGVSQESINFPVAFSSKPKVVCTFCNDVNDAFFYCSASSITASNFLVKYSDVLNSNQYKLEIFAEV